MGIVQRRWARTDPAKGMANGSIRELICETGKHRRMFDLSNRVLISYFGQHCG